MTLTEFMTQELQKQRQSDIDRLNEEYDIQCSGVGACNDFAAECWDAGRASGLDKQKLLDDLQERLEAVKELILPNEHPEIRSYIDGQIYQLESLISDVNFGCFDVREITMVTADENSEG